MRSEEFLRAPEMSQTAVLDWVRSHLPTLWRDRPLPTKFRGGQAAADQAIASFDVNGYADARNEVWPESARGASRLSPYIRHGLLSLPRVWADITGPDHDVRKFRDELLWQEYARHLYARLGATLGNSLRFSVPDSTSAAQNFSAIITTAMQTTTTLRKSNGLDSFIPSAPG